MSDNPKELSRRDLLRYAGTGAAATIAAQLFPLKHLKAFDTAGNNPLAMYPNRGWEKLYRDHFQYDSVFHFTCAPNDTHNCHLRAFVKNGVVTRLGPSYGYGKATDIYGNKASARWDPRLCQKGLGLVRRIYGDRRITGPRVRLGFKRWIEDGFPRDPATGRAPDSYMQRGRDKWVKVSWDQAGRMAALALADIATAYTGEPGAARLKAQGYDPAMIEDMHGAGVETLKFRGGMAFLGATRVFGLHRFANMLALLDAQIRNVGPDKAVAGRNWDSYAWHTDLPPGHPMVTGNQTVDFDLSLAEHANVIIMFGMNWIATKMPDSHWLTEARLKGTHIVDVTTDYHAVSNKADEVFIIRPGTDGAVMLGMSQVVLSEKLYDEKWVKGCTDLPFLIRMDTLTTLRAKEVFPGYQNAALTRTKVLAKGEKPPMPASKQDTQYLPQELRDEWGDFVVWDARKNAAAAITRDQCGAGFAAAGVDPAIEGTFKLTLVDGTTVEARPVFALVKEYLDGSFTPKQVEALTWAKADALAALARRVAANPEKVLMPVGMGPNHYFNNDTKDRALFLLAALTRNVGFPGGNVGSYAGNYRAALFSGMPQYIVEDPFNIELDPEKPSKTKKYFHYESAHFYNYSDRPLRVGNKLFTGKTHMPTPTKSMWFANGNSILGNIKWHYDVVQNTLPKIEAIFVNDWWWTATCEYADIVFGVDSWAETKVPDMTASCTNPFLHSFPRTPLVRLGDTRPDIQVYATVAEHMARIRGDSRFRDYWKFAAEGRSDVYLQRIMNASNALNGYRWDDVEAKGKDGIPSIMLTRTYPKYIGHEQAKEGRPWYTRSGRMEFYRDEPEFREYGENLPVYREPVESTFYEANVIVAKPHPAIRPTGPEAYGIAKNDYSAESRQVRNVVLSVDELLKTKHPLASKGYEFIFMTPKYRHGAHTTPVDTDQVAVWFGPFGDVYRHDKRKPFVTEGYVDINPNDARKLGVEDGDYIWIDGDPADRPYRGWKPGTDAYELSRLLCRARYYNGIPTGVLRMYFNMYGSTYGSVKGTKSRPDGMAKNPETNYQAMFRRGSHQSATRAWLRPTLQTDSLPRKENMGQVIGKGFEIDVHGAVGAPKESFVKITRAEPGGEDGKGRWKPLVEGLRPGSESPAFKLYLTGKYVA